MKVRSAREIALNLKTVQFPSTEIAAQKGWNGGATRRTVEGSVQEAWGMPRPTRRKLEAAVRREASGATSPQRFAYLTACGMREIENLKKKRRAANQVAWSEGKRA